MSQIGMFPNMFGMNPNNINLNTDPSQMANMSITSNMPGFAAPLYPGAFPGMQIPQQSQIPGRNQNN